MERIREAFVADDAGALQGEVEARLAVLTERERYVIKLRLGLDDGVSRSLGDIAKDLGITRSSVWGTEQRALWKLRGFKIPS